MLSGNGRHRRPSQASALVVAAGVTGSAIAIPLLGASGAAAADGTAWDRVADCETGGAWSRNGGNGYYGGLQLSQDQWERYGGLDHASSADQASRSRQIETAERILAAEGVAAWPTCGPLAGLVEGVGATIDDPAAPDGPSVGAGGAAGAVERAEEIEGVEEAAGSERRGEGGARAGGASATPFAADAGTPSDPDTAPGADEADASDRREASRADVGTVEEPHEEPGEGVGDETSTRPGADPRSDAETADSAPSATGRDGKDRLPRREGDGTGRHRGEPADESDGGEAAGEYTVRSGDTLSRIAEGRGTSGGWSALYSANRAVIGDDPDHILPGQTLRVAGQALSAPSEFTP
ncbi:LysM peptidoglycan-binding domain-containing protein [Streptomyces sp. WMMC905]|uniref:LysM peptidoglycan-binding domain-containing protein n=1 Tax=Streptomyces sp. WMMC905 TaxID=3404123 RepID=UPI003B926EBC